MFARISAEGDDAAEIQFALGSLFRRRGETERAIRVHERLRASTPEGPLHDQAGFALALDFLSAGLMDRAEKLFQELAARGEYRAASIDHLMRIYEQQRDWANALRVFHELPTTIQADRRRVAAHYLCELAELALVQGDVARATLLVEQTRTHDAQFPRALFLGARLLESEGRIDAAIATYLAALDVAPALLLEIVPRVVELAPAGMDGDVVQELSRRLRESRTLSSRQLAWGLASTLPAEASSRLPLDLGMSEKEGASLGVVSGLVRAVADLGGRYQCSDCGFRSVSWYWHCPSCRAWDSLQPTLLQWADRARLNDIATD